MFEDFSNIVKKRVISAFHTVTRSLFSFLPFLITMFIIVFSLLTASFFATQGYTTEKADIESAYNYHVAVKGLNQSQMLRIRDDVLTVFTNDFCYQAVATDTHTYGDTTTYDVYLRLLTGNKNYGFRTGFIEDSLRSNYETFLSRYRAVIFPDGEEFSTVSVSTSPLYDLEAHAREAQLHRFLFLLAISILSTFLLMGIYNVRVNNQKFLYGIYSTFGADKARLCATSVYEILLCAGLVFLPALFCSVLVCRHVFAEASTGFVFSITAMLLPLPFVFVIAWTGTYLPLKALSKQEPMQMIVAEDNSNLVSSPSRSANMLRANTALKYEKITLFRFRNRTIKLLALSAIFSAMFISGLYLAEVYAMNTDIRAKTSSSFSLDFHDGIPEDAISLIESINGVREVHGDYRSIRTSLLTSHVLVKKTDAAAFSGLHPYTKNKNYYVETDFNYIAVDSDDVANRFKSFYRVEGDPTRILSEPKTVAVGVSKNNRSIYDFQVGDTISIGVLQNAVTEKLSEDLTGYALLDAQVETFPYRYITLTVGAVIHDYPSSLYGTPLLVSGTLFDELLHIETESLAPPVTMSIEAEPPASPETTSAKADSSTPTETASAEAETSLPQETLTTSTVSQGASSPIETKTPEELAAPEETTEETWEQEPVTVPVTNLLHVYLQEGLKGKDVDKIETSLRSIATAYKNVSVISNGTYHDGLIEESKQYASLLSILAISFLLFVPIIWFFTQILFYSRRSTEFDILLSIAADMKRVRKLHTADSILLGLAALLSLPFSAFCTFLINKFFTLILPTYIKYGAEIVVEPAFSPLPYLLCMALTLICSMLSALIPFLIYKYRKQKAEKQFSPSADM